MKTHAAYIAAAIVIAILLTFGFTAWRQEHDARLVAEVKIVAAEQNIAHLQTDIQAITAQRDAKLSTLEKQRKTVSTPAAAIAAIPDLSTLPLSTRTVSDDPSRVSVDALSLFNELNSCRQTEVKLDACSKTAALNTAIVADKDVVISALRKKPSFFKRLGSTLKIVGIGIGIGVALGHGL